MASASGSVPKEQAPNTPTPPPNVKKYSDLISLHTNPISGNGQTPSPLLLFFPSLGSKAKNHEKYIQLYFKLGFDVLVAESLMSHFLWPRNGLEYAKQLLDLLMGGEDLSSRRLFIHAMSIGGYIFSQMLVCSSKEQREMLDRIHGQVFDSLVGGSIEYMATAVALMVSSPRWQSLVVRGLLLFFSLLKAQTTDYYERGIRAFEHEPVHCPTLVFYCLNDPMNDRITVEELMRLWEEQGLEVQGKKWENSAHAGHLRRHPEEYTETLNAFITNILNNMSKSRL